MSSTNVNVIDSPRNNDDVECCNVDSSGHRVLDIALGHATTTLEVVQVRARVNGASWHTGLVVNSDPLDPAGYLTSWEVGQTPTASLTGGNTLECEVKLSDGTWVAAAPTIYFTAFCIQQPEPPMRIAAMTYYVQLPEPDPPTVPWALLTSKLAKSQAVRLKRAKVRAKEGGTFVWESGERPTPFWRMKLLSHRVAELTMRLPVRRSGRRATLVQRWVSGKFNLKSGGEFLPVGETVVIRSILEVRKTKEG